MTESALAQTAPPAIDLNEFSTDAIALQRQPPALRARLVLWTLAAFALLATVYAYAASMDVVITGQGRIVPSAKTAVVQAYARGRIQAIYVEDKQKVRAGEALIAIDSAVRPTAGAEKIAPPTTVANTGRAAAPAHALLDARLLESLSKLAALQADVTRKRAEREAVEQQLSQLAASLPLVSKKHSMRAELAKTGHMAETGVIETQLELYSAEKELLVQRNRLQEVDAALHAATQQLNQAETEFKSRYPANLVQIVRAPAGGQNLDKRQLLHAPTDGTVHWLSVPAVGETVSVGQNLLVIVPESAPLEVEAMLLNKDIGHLELGQRAIVKIETFDYTRYGYIEGRVQWLGADAVIDPKLGPVYVARIAVDATQTPNIVYGRRGHIVPGMNATVDVHVAERRMLSYFVAPLLRYKEESLRER